MVGCRPCLEGRNCTLGVNSCVLGLARAGGGSVVGGRLSPRSGAGVRRARLAVGLGRVSAGGFCWKCSPQRSFCRCARARRALAAPPREASHWLRLGGGVSARACLGCSLRSPTVGRVRSESATRAAVPIAASLSSCCPGRSVRGH